MEGVSYHNFQYADINETHHTTICVDCGYEDDWYHNFAYTSMNAGNHSAVCTNCGYSIVQIHDLVCVKVDNQYHGFVCADCNYISEPSLHTFKATEGGSIFKTCSGCGCIVKTGGNLIFPVDSIKGEESAE